MRAAEIHNCRAHPLTLSCHVLKRTSLDLNMRDMYKANGLQIFADWLKQTDAEIRAYAALCVSNLSRTGASQSREHSRIGQHQLTVS